MSARGRKALSDLLVRAARGQWSSSQPSAAASGSAAAASPTHQLPCFPLQQHHFGQLAGAARCPQLGESAPPSGVATPADFHAFLCDKIRAAEERVVLASLYVGVGTNPNDAHQTPRQVVDGTAEDEFLQALQDTASNNRLKKMQVLLDANRALRKVSIAKKHHSHNMHTNSAQAVHSRIDRYLGGCPTSQKSGVFLFPVNDKRLCALLPSPLDEVAGVFHIKAYIVDDSLILSGANLSEEYFSNRLDRYMLFTNGGGGLVDFYADLVDRLCEYAVRYEGKSGARGLSDLFSVQDEMDRKTKLEASLMQLFDGTKQYDTSDGRDRYASPVVAYAIPTLQMPGSFRGRPFRVKSDAEVTRNLLSCALTSQQSASVRLSSAYLNLTPKLLSVLTKYGNGNKGASYILTAGLASHGFAPKPASQTKRGGFVDRIKAAVPEAFMTLVKDAAKSITACRGKILLYERPGWTFHAKGIWITDDDDNGTSRPEAISNPSSLLATIIGSGNYGARSEDLDVESNCILVFANDGSESEEGSDHIKERVASEWNDMCNSSTELTDVKSTTNEGNVMRFVLAYMRRFL